MKVLSSVVELYRQFIVEIDRDAQRARRVTAADAIARFRAEDERLGGLLPQLEEALAQTSNGTALSRRIAAALQELREAAADVQAAAGAQDEERSRVMHLASIGPTIRCPPSAGWAAGDATTSGRATEVQWWSDQSLCHVAVNEMTLSVGAQFLCVTFRGCTGGARQ